jgi:glucuronate isomerase
MKSFLSEDFILETETARRLYHEYAKQMPIIDYHCHLPPDEIAADKVFENITKIWLNGDHYKWRAMRTNGVNEHYITGRASDKEKFEKWAETVPYTARNPLFHWTHMELKNPFGIEKILNATTAHEIYEHTTALLQSKLSVRNLLRHFNVQVICTTDDPADSLEHHQKIRESGFEIKILPTFRPDKAMNVESAADFNAYLEKLGTAANMTIATYQDLLDAVKKRHDYFAAMGCRLSDHGLETIYATPYTEQEVSQIFDKIRSGKELETTEKLKFMSAMLYYFAILDHEKGWTQQFHIGAIRNNNARMQRILGADAGFDSIGDFEVARSMSAFFNRLDSTDQLAKTIIYNLNPAWNDVYATMIGNFNDGSVAGKMQYGSAWWFLDQKDGMEKQMNALSNMGLLSRFVGMLTDSRSFLSYSRHEYFRRILCNLLGKDVENGELPQDFDWLGGMVQDICYKNANSYFGF